MKLFSWLFVITSLVTLVTNAHAVTPMQEFVREASAVAAMSRTDMFLYMEPKVRRGEDNVSKFQIGKTAHEEGIARISSHFERLKGEFATNQDATRILKDYYASWMSTMDHIASGARVQYVEGKIRYDTQLEDLATKMKEKGNRLKLE